MASGSNPQTGRRKDAGRTCRYGQSGQSRYLPIAPPRFGTAAIPAKIQVSGKEAYQTLRPISGYSLFVSGENPKFDQSYKLASSIGKEIRAIGRTPAAHHAEPITGENRPWLDKENGVYRYDKLAVLRQTVMPAVLLEFGVIVDRDDEAYVDDAINRRRMTEAVVRALRPYRHH